MVKKKYFIFDLDNTLVKTDLANNNSYRDAIHAVTGIDIQIKQVRFTRADLSYAIPNLSSDKISEIIKLKEDFYSKHIQETILNEQLVKILSFLKELGNETILLTESHKLRAKQVCEHYSLAQFFNKQYYKENFGTSDKYQYLKTQNIPFSSIVLFENEENEIQKAIQNGICEYQIIKVKF
ncbi:MAG: HAD hydrolase-like protein [Bacteroidales bacterium]|nr:HAD hydrolase-like protein [Bacteroidales bacterium]